METSLTKAVATVVANTRKQAGLSQEELAHLSELDRTYISGIERGVRNITLNSIKSAISTVERKLVLRKLGSLSKDDIASAEILLKQFLGL